MSFVQIWAATTALVTIIPPFSTLVDTRAGTCRAQAKRVRALRQLCRDTVRAMVWAVGEEDALLLEQLMRAAGPDALEQGWLLAELQARFGLSTEALSRRCDKSTSWVLFFQCYPRFTRFECKSFLAAAIAYFCGAAKTCMIDNTHVVVASGTGAQMVPAPEMEDFARRYGFRFVAHEKGDANRSARVEAPFHRIETAFLKGTEFTDWAELNQKARETSEQWNAARSNKLHGSRRELFACERPQLRALPLQQLLQKPAAQARGGAAR